MTTESRMPSATELRIIHQFVDPRSTKNRTLEQILNEINDVNLIIKLIKHKQAYDFYDQWKDHSDSNVRLALVSNGYFLDYYVHDEIDNIRHMAIYRQPEIRQKLLENPTINELSFVQDYLYNKSEPDRNHLKKYLDLCSKEGVNNEQHEALLLKYSSMTCDLDTIAKTMTPAQLYASDNPLWALNFAGYDINKLFKRLENQPKTEEAFNTALYNIQNPMLVLDEFGNLRLNKRHPNNSM